MTLAGSRQALRTITATAAVLVSLVAPAALSAQSTARSVTGTIIIAHGADSTWNSHVFEVAKQVNTGGPVEVSFLMGQGAKAARFQDVVRKLESQGVSEIVLTL